MFSNELDRLIIEHIADLDEGAKRLELISLKVAEEIDSLVRDWASEQEWISGDGTWEDDGDVSVCPPSGRPDGDAWLAYFSLGYAGNDDDNWSEEKDYFWLTRLCAEGRGQMGFRLHQSEFGKTPWKKFLSQQAGTVQNTRFVLDDLPSIFLPVKVNAQALAAGVENETIADALSPIREALDHIKANWQIFDELLSNMRARQA